jgi:3-hydroxymyristoyl/3-hydroxydecanoyl-(acyl carrier protein) dehydratase
MSQFTGTQFVYYAQSAVGPAIATTSSHPLWRRMTWTSKALLAAVTNWENTHGVKLSEITNSARVSFYYATLFGEMEAGLTVAAGILKPNHVVSPAAFQQSVHNSPVAYLMQSLKCENPTMTITSGHGSFDRAIATASSDLLAGETDIAVVLQAAEYHIAPQPKGINATSEMVVITAGRRLEKQACWNIESIAWSYSGGPDTGGHPQQLTSDALFSEPLNLEQQEKSFIRECQLTHGRSIVSSWQKNVLDLTGTLASKFIPHREPMLLVDTLTEIQPNGSGRVSATLRESTIVFDNGHIRPHALVEVLAQAAGVVFNAARPLKTVTTSARFGYLLSVDDFDAAQASQCKPGDVLDVHLTLVADLFPLGKYFAAAYLDGVKVAEASMKFLSDENSELAKTKVTL